MDSQPQNPEFRNNPESFTHENVKLDIHALCLEFVSMILCLSYIYIYIYIKPPSWHCVSVLHHLNYTEIFFKA